MLLATHFAHSATCTSTPLFCVCNIKVWANFVANSSQICEICRLQLLACCPSFPFSPFSPYFPPSNAFASVHLRLSQISFRLNPRQERMSSKKIWNAYVRVLFLFSDHFCINWIPFNAYQTYFLPLEKYNNAYKRWKSFSIILVLVICEFNRMR